MNHILGNSTTEIEAYLERIANALEVSNEDTINTVRNASQNTEKEKEETWGNLKPEERFFTHVDRLRKDFQLLVESFTDGDAQNVNFMEKYPFTSFSLVQLSEAVNEWSTSLRVINKVEEHNKRIKEGTRKEG